MPIVTALITGLCAEQDKDADIYSVAQSAPVIARTGVVSWGDLKHTKLNFTDTLGTESIFCDVYRRYQYCLPSASNLPLKINIGVIDFRGRNIIVQASDSAGNEIINRRDVMAHLKANSQDVKRLTFWHMAPIGLGIGFAIAAVFEPRPRRKKSVERPN